MMYILLCINDHHRDVFVMDYGPQITIVFIFRDSGSLLNVQYLILTIILIVCGLEGRIEDLFNLLKQLKLF